jgi:NADPH:quinone reductase-like Zn-dependent oxidoreductase
MHAVMFHRYGPPEVLTPVELPIPAPRGDQVQIRVQATTVTSAECGMRRGEPRWGRIILGPLRPRAGVRVLGLEFAGEVTALGPVFDYTVEDFATSGERYDIVFDTVSRGSFARCRPVLTPRGSYLPTTGLANNVLQLRTALTGGPRVRTGMSVRKHAALAELRGLLEQGELRIVVDRTYPLSEIVAAHRYVDGGHKVGNVVVTIP